MILILEVNAVHHSSYCPKQNERKWTDEEIQTNYHEESEIHLLKLSPVNSDILSSKINRMDVKGVQFIWDEKTEELRWNGGNEMKPISQGFLTHFVHQLNKIRFERLKIPAMHDSASNSFLTKTFWQFENKF